MTKRPKPETQPSSVSHTAVGDYVVSVVNDGIFQISFNDIVGVDQARAQAAHVDMSKADCRSAVERGMLIADVKQLYAKVTEPVEAVPPAEAEYIRKEKAD